MTLSNEQVKAIGEQFAAIAIKHGGVLTDRAKGAIRFPTKEAREAFEAEYMAAPSVI